MLSRKDVRPRQIKLLLDNGLLPVSIDYRLCPELNLLQGPMTDVCDGLRWARDELPNLRLKCLGIQVDGNQVVVVGWSSGGHLATTLAWTARLRNLRPPEAILAFYCPLDYDDECEYLESPELSVLLLMYLFTVWRQPNFPGDSSSYSSEDCDLLEAVRDKPVGSYVFVVC